MKVKALLDICGIGYNLKKGEEADLKKELAEVLIAFEHAEEVKTKPKKAVE